MLYMHRLFFFYDCANAGVAGVVSWSFNSGGFVIVVASITLVKGFILRIGMDLWSCMACSLLLRCEYASSRYDRLASFGSFHVLIIS